MSNYEMQEAPRHFRGRMFRQDASRSKEKWILILKTGLAGTKFHIQNEAERDAVAAIKPGTELLLYRETNNEHDPWAVAVYLTEKDQIGYITRGKNETIARLMDAGKKVIAITDDPEERLAGLPEEERESRRAYWVSLQSINIPFCVYLVETDA